MEQAVSRELISLRKEIKYVVPVEKAMAIKSQLDNLLAKDSYCTNGTYSVRSLYFESIDNVDFEDKIAGVNFRKKVRARIYNGSPYPCKLELKQKQGDLQQKLSFIISQNDAVELARGNYSVLKNYFDNTETSIKVYAVMIQGHYSPVVQIEYDRIAYRYPMYDTRITLDMNIRSSESNMNLFAPIVHYTPIMCESAVLEVKYNGKLMGFITDTLNQFNLTQGSYSKYCSGRMVYYDFIW